MQFDKFCRLLFGESVVEEARTPEHMRVKSFTLIDPEYRYKDVADIMNPRNPARTIFLGLSWRHRKVPAEFQKEMANTVLDMAVAELEDSGGTIDFREFVSTLETIVAKVLKDNGVAPYAEGIRDDAKLFYRQMVARGMIKENLYGKADTKPEDARQVANAPVRVNYEPTEELRKAFLDQFGEAGLALFGITDRALSFVEDATMTSGELLEVLRDSIQSSAGELPWKFKAKNSPGKPSRPEAANLSKAVYTLLVRFGQIKPAGAGNSRDRMVDVGDTEDDPETSHDRERTIQKDVVQQYTGRYMDTDDYYGPGGGEY